ncbi:MAG: ABC transporter substrate-binding protein [Spirochaetales bacterium]|jgi:iron complex transport system substrate-binding protein|nr:ABC transporter substrate-binding protein [Spirochaetales bacterium]
MRKYGFKICAATLLFCLLISGKGIAAEAGKKESIRIQDATGRFVEVRLPVKKLVVLTSDALEIIRALKAEDLVVGINTGIAKEPLFWPGLKNKPTVGSWRGPNYELIVELNPDIVIGYARHPGQDMEKKLVPLGITVIRLDFYKMHSMVKEIEILGRILGKEQEARQLICWYQEKLNLIERESMPLRNRPDVYVESYSKYHTAGPGSGGHEMCVLAGGNNIASNFSIPYPEITPEWVLAKNPHIVVKAAALSNCFAMIDPDPLKSVRDEIMARPAWDNIRAVQDGKVYVMTSDIWTGPRAIIGICYMAKWFHPEVFKYLDPEKLHREYLEKFQGIKYQGVYVYPVVSGQ